MEREILTPLNQRELKEFGEIEQMNTAQVIFEKKPIVAAAMKV